MKKLEIFDPALCCSSGVCGPEPDQALVAFAGLLKKCEGQAEIQRYNLSQEPAAFVDNELVGRILKEEGPEALPVILLDGKLIMKGVYPSREQLESLLGCPEDEACRGDAPEKETANTSSCCEDDSCC